ncbi:MAG: hypothetical protein FD177_1804 [Desulfovibrionaceae bacterium]|nr:MAG: hypothetical protein FD177_1804 [Desulfovibrionaceae bacterium]
MTDHRNLANAIRALSMDAVQQANSGHPGAPMGMADIAEVLWNDFLKHNPSDPDWWDRDRFVLSNGHASMLLYSCLYLSGYDLNLEDLRNFRQMHAKTPGHPERGRTPGVETTTGPLGQGLANAVGMALAERTMAARYNQPGYDIVDHRTYALCGDGCLMEGISHEACSLAGTLGLGKLTVLWDDNGISIDGHVAGWFSEDVPTRFEAYGWHVVRAVDGHDAQSVANALREAQSESDRPSLLCCKTVIGFGAPTVCGSHDCHGAPLGRQEIEAARAALDWPHGTFEVPEGVRQAWDACKKGNTAQQTWKETFAAFAIEHPTLAAEFKARMEGTLPKSFEANASKYILTQQHEGKNLATRKASQNALDAFAPQLPGMFGGSADLTSSNLTNWKGCVRLTNESLDGNYLSYGVREFGMAAIMNGMALHGGFIPFGGTFLVFSDYARNAMRMAALMELQVIHVLTHDSIGVGEDGPTHQPVEHTASLRLIPGMSVWRPCDATETATAWKTAVTRRNGPTSLILSRQPLKAQVRTRRQVKDIARGGYILRDCSGIPAVVLIGSGSEVQLAMETAELLERARHAVRVVSMPCMDVFEAQSPIYRSNVLPEESLLVAVEAGIQDNWWRLVGRDGLVCGMTGFGESAPGDVLWEHFGFTPSALAAQVLRALAKREKRRKQLLNMVVNEAHSVVLRDRQTTV